MSYRSRRTICVVFKDIDNWNLYQVTHFTVFQNPYFHYISQSLWQPDLIRSHSIWCLRELLGFYSVPKIVTTLPRQAITKLITKSQLFWDVTCYLVNSYRCTGKLKYLHISFQAVECCFPRV
jgi:hypothetical protein